MAGFSFRQLFEKARRAIFPTAKPASHRRPVIIQIGLDFGTAFTKVVCRDVTARRAWVYVPASPKTELPFLLPSVLFAGKAGNDWSLAHASNALHQFELGAPKLALSEITSNIANSADITELYRRIAADTGLHASEFIRDAVSFYLSGILGGVLRHLRESDLGFGSVPGDSVAVCMALPAQSMAEAPLKTAFLDCLRRGYWLATLHDPPNGAVGVMELRRRLSEFVPAPGDEWRCQLYPEVSANMVAYTQSRAAEAGIFQMLDVGAGTVDISFFIFVRNAEAVTLNNFSGIVAHCGSSFIERKAAAALGRSSDPEMLARLRRIKEGARHGTAEEQSAIDEALTQLREPVATATHCSIIEMMRMLNRQGRRQLHDTRFVFVGGGLTDDPYRRSATQTWESLGRTNQGIAGIPPPSELEPHAQCHAWFPRLTVAYGLSFDSNNRPGATTPGDHEPPPEGPPPPERPNATTKDEV
jgi:hypothetical protein